jgi:hypothetical protein
MIPHAVLSDQLVDSIKGRRVVAAVFLTFEFDPGFFEQEVLPLLMNLAVSHARVIRLLQLEDALRDCAGNVAVFYDADRLVRGSAGAAQLDVRRIPVRHAPGVFHPKNILLLVEERDADKNGHRAQGLLVGAMSANLTRSGWWENVEAGHFEEIQEYAPTRMKDDLLSLFRLLNQRTGMAGPHKPIETIRKFLLATEQRTNRSSDQTMFPHFFAGNSSFPDFLEECAGVSLQGLYLEIISPFLGDAATSGPLETLIERFHPKEIRILLPRDQHGAAACTPELFKSIGNIENASWGKLPIGRVSSSEKKEAPQRFVHAKLYRFFSQKPKREFCFVGSVNLTEPAHQRTGNWETGFLVEVDCPRAPDFWLEPEKTKPDFSTPDDDTDPAKSGGTPLLLRYHWDKGLAEAFWDQEAASPGLQLAMRGVTLGQLDPLHSRTWVQLDPTMTGLIHDLLKETSFVEVSGHGERPGLLLIQEEGMAQKPSMLLSLSVADILRYWSLLTADQRAAFVEAKTLDLAQEQDGAELLAKVQRIKGEQTFFDRFAGMFHAFSCLENAVREKLSAKPPCESEADYRLFGKKYDSLGTLLERVFSDTALTDDIERYILMLCAKQVVQELKRDYEDYWKSRKDRGVALELMLARTQEIRDRIAISDKEPDMPAFLDWFDGWFLKRARTQEMDE